MARNQIFALRLKKMYFFTTFSNNKNGFSEKSYIIHFCQKLTEDKSFKNYNKKNVNNATKILKKSFTK